MTLVSVGVTQAMLERRPVADVLGIPSGPSSRGSTYWSRVLRCGHEHALANVLGWVRTVPEEALDTGIVWHYLLERYYEHAKLYQDDYRMRYGLAEPGRDLSFLRGHDAQGQRIAFEALQAFADEPGYEVMYATLGRMLDAYFTFAASDRWEVAGIEVTIDVPLPFGAGFEYSTRLDLLVIDYGSADPVLRIVEHKSAHRIDSMVLEGYTQDLQTLGQVWCAEKRLDLAAYPPFVGSIVNITSKTKTPQCDRVLLSPSPETLTAWEDAMRAQAATLPVSEALGWPKNYGSCVRRYGRCPFFHVCRALPSMRAADAAKLVDLPLGFARGAVGHV